MVYQLFPNNPKLLISFLSQPTMAYQRCFPICYFPWSINHAGEPTVGNNNFQPTISELITSRTVGKLITIYQFINKLVDIFPKY